MTKVKGQCKLIAQTNDNFTKDLKIGQIFDFEKEYVEALKGMGYYIIVSPEKVHKIKEESFKLYFKEKPIDAGTKEPEKKEEIANGQGAVAEAAQTTDKQQNKFNEPKKNIEKETPEINAKNVSVLHEWKRYEHLINGITLKPFDGKSGMVNVIVNVKPDIDLTMTAPAENVFNSIFPSLSKLETIEGKIQDLTSIIEERVKLEKQKLESAKKSAEKVEKKEDKKEDKKDDKATTKDKPKSTKAPVETKPESGTLFDNAGSNDAKSESEEEDWGEKTDEKGDESGAGGNDVDNW